MPGDNFAVRVVSEGRSHFEAAIRLAFEESGHLPKKAVHYVNGLKDRQCSNCVGTGKCHHAPVGGYKKGVNDSVVSQCGDCSGTGRLPPEPAMILFWSEEKMVDMESLPLPFPLAVDGAIAFLWEWLQGVEYPREPDQDGSNEKGFEVTTGDFWGHCAGSHYSIVMVKPDWQMYGK